MADLVKFYGTVREVLISDSVAQIGAAVVPVNVREVIVEAPAEAVSLSWRYGALAQQAVQRRVGGGTPPDDYRSPIDTASFYELVAFSLRASYRGRVNGFVQQIVQHRLVADTSFLRVSTLRETVTQRRVTALLHSPGEVATTVAQVAQRRDADLTVIGMEHVAGQVQQVVQAFPRIIAGSMIEVPSYVQTLAQHRAPLPYWSELYVVTLHNLAAVKRVVPSPSTARGPVQAHTFLPLVVQHRETAQPGSVSTWQAGTARQQVILARPLAPFNSTIRANSLRMLAVQRFVVPAPGDVVDQRVGEHVGLLRALVVQHRVVEAPPVISLRSRFVFQTSQQVATSDAFPDPTMTLSDAVVSGLAARPVVGDAGFPDPLLPVSDATVTSVAARPVVGETYPDPFLAFSDALVTVMASHAAVGDAGFPDPLLAQSDALVGGMAQFAAVGDASFPDPLLATSEARALLVGAIAVVGDTFNSNGSEAEVQVVQEMLVMRDPTLMRIPARTDRRRPIVTVSLV